MASGNAGNYQSIPALFPDNVPIPATAGSVNIYMNLDDSLNIWTVDHFKVHRPINSSSLSPSYQATAVNDITTSSIVDVIATGMTLTPPAGTYLVWFSGSAEFNSEETNSDLIFFSIYSNAVQVASSEERTNVAPGVSTTPGVNFTFNCVAKVTVNGSQAIDGRWRVGLATSVGTMHQRNITALKVAS